MVRSRRARGLGRLLVAMESCIAMQGSEIEGHQNQGRGSIEHCQRKPNPVVSLIGDEAETERTILQHKLHPFRHC